MKTKVILGTDDLILRTKLKTDYYWTTIYNLEEFGPIREIELGRKWPSTEEDRVFSPPKGRSRTKKHLMTPSPNDERNKRHKFYSHSSDNESDNDNLIDEELRAKFMKMKGKKNKKVSMDMEKEDFVKQKGKKHKNKK